MRCKGQNFVKCLFTTLMVVVVTFSFQVTGLEASPGKDLRFSIGLKGGYSFWSLEDLGISQNIFVNGTGISGDDVTGAEFKGSLFGGIDLSLESNKLGLNAGFILFPRKTFGDGPASVFESDSTTLELSTFVIPVELYYNLPVSKNLFLKLGAGLDYYKATADYDNTVYSDGTEYFRYGKLKDSGVRSHISLEVQYFLNKKKSIAMTLDADYSFAKMNNFTGTLVDSEGTETEALLTIQDSELGEILGTYPVKQSLPTNYRPAELNFNGLKLSVGFKYIFKKQEKKTLVIPTEGLVQNTDKLRLEIIVQKTAYPGDTLQVRVLHKMQPVWVPTMEGPYGRVNGVLVMYNNEVKSTNEEGYAEFIVPETIYPETMRIDVMKKGYWSYDTLNINGTNYLFEVGRTMTVLLPKGQFYKLDQKISKRLKRIKVIETVSGELGYTQIDLTAIREKLKGTNIPITSNMDKSETKTVTKQDILNSLGTSGDDSIWVFYGHGDDSDGDNVNDVILDSSGKKISIDELCEKFEEKGAPAVIILAGCATTHIMMELCKCGANLVIAFNVPVISGRMATTVAKILQWLLDGWTIEKIKNEVREKRMIKGSEGEGWAISCVGEGLFDDTTGLTLSDLLPEGKRKKRTKTTLFRVILQTTQDKKQVEILAKFKLTDEDDNPLGGKEISVLREIFVPLPNAPDNNYRDLEKKYKVFLANNDLKFATTNLQGIATMELIKVSNYEGTPWIYLYEAKFKGDEEYESSKITNFEKIK